MKTIWLSYAWSDNYDKDVDFIANEIKKTGINVKLDRHSIQAGSRLWDQIGRFIEDESQSDGWVFYATQNSLCSEPCKEEYEYALNRALNSRGSNYPIIAIFPGSVDETLIPPGIKSRLYVSLTDPDWKERITASLENRSIKVTSTQLKPYVLKIYEQEKIIEIRPRAGNWSPFVVGIPLTEKIAVAPYMVPGAPNKLPRSAVLNSPGKSTSLDGNWHLIFAENGATPTQSYYIGCQVMPSKLIFGVLNTGPQFIHNL